MLPHNIELQIIDFSINLIPVSPQRFFVRNTELRSINLRAKKITQISPGTFHTNKNITALDLSHNKIQELDDDLFAETQINTESSCQFFRIEGYRMDSAAHQQSVNDHNVKSSLKK
jgi:Leucine-rich repeat (LRR) protein